MLYLTPNAVADHGFQEDMLNLRFLWKTLVERSSRKTKDCSWPSEEASGSEMEL